MSNPVPTDARRAPLGTLIQAPEQVSCQPMTCGQKVVRPGLISLWSMFCEAYTTPIVDRESSNRRWGSPLCGFSS
jgi:hypothetical protein